MQTNLPEPKYFLCSLTARAARKMAAHYNRVLEPLGITSQQMIALGVLWREENISLGVFARRMVVGKAAATAMIKRLEAMGLVTSQPHPDDGRLNRLRLTDKARELAPRIAKEVHDLEKAIEEAVGSQTTKTLFEGLLIINRLDM